MLDTSCSPARRLWRIYAFFLTGSLLLSYAHAGATDPDPVLLIDIALSVIAISGLFGYAYGRRVMRPEVWAAAAFLMPAWDTLVNFVLYHPEGKADPMSVTFTVALLVPEYIALWRYGRASSPIWAQKQTAAAAPRT